MKTRIVCLLVVLALFALLVSGCSSGGKKDQDTTTPTQVEEAFEEDTESSDKTPIPAEESSIAEEPEEDSEESEQVYYSELDDLTQLDSYRVHTIIHWEDTDGDTGSMDMMIEFTRDPLAQRMVIGNTDNGTLENMEMISIGDTAYMKVGEEDWISIQSEDLSVDEIGQVWGAEDFLNNGDADYLGTETINGIETKHYRYRDSAFIAGAGFTDIDEAEAEVWVSTKHNIYIKMIMHVKGHDADGINGSFDFESTLDAINEPITIAVPEGVAKPGLPEDIPLMDGATEVSAFGQMVSFNVNQSISQVAAYYKTAMASNGWEVEDSILEEIQNYVKDDRSATIMISQAEEDDENVSSVVIMVEGAE